MSEGQPQSAVDCKIVNIALDDVRRRWKHSCREMAAHVTRGAGAADCQGKQGEEVMDKPRIDD